MKHTPLTKIFKNHPPEVQKLLRQVLRLEQQYITSPLAPNSLAHKELKEKIDAVIEEMVKE